MKIFIEIARKIKASQSQNDLIIKMRIHGQRSTGNIKNVCILLVVSLMVLALFILVYGHQNGRLELDAIGSKDSPNMGEIGLLLVEIDKMSTLLLFMAMPLVLGSIISFVITLAYIPIIAKRIGNEEKVLEDGLHGYAEYKNKVKRKVVPFIW